MKTQEPFPFGIPLATQLRDQARERLSDANREIEEIDVEAVTLRDRRRVLVAERADLERMLRPPIKRTKKSAE